MVSQSAKQSVVGNLSRLVATFRHFSFRNSGNDLKFVQKVVLVDLQKLRRYHDH